MYKNQFYIKKNSLINLLFRYGVLAMCAVFVLSCSKSSSDDDGFIDGISVDILDILGAENLKMLEEDLAMPIHRGSNPPNIELFYLQTQLDNAELYSQEGVAFVMAPMIMLETVVPDDLRSPGDQFWDLYVMFKNQDMDKNTVDFSTRHIQEPQANANNAFIVGDENKFTIAAQSVQEREGKQIRLVDVFSAKLVDGGLSEAHYALVMVDNAGFEDRIPNGTGRSFYDSEEFSELTNWPSVLLQSFETGFGVLSK